MQTEGYTAFEFRIFSLSSQKTMISGLSLLKTIPCLPYSDEAQFLPVDLYSEGISGILYTDQNTHLYFAPLGNGHFAAPISPASMPIDKQLTDPQYSLMDLGGDGRLDLVVQGKEYQGYYSMGPDRNWNNFQPFEFYPLRDPLPNQESLDINGDGLQDLLLNEVNSLVCYISEGKRGYKAGVRVANGGRNATTSYGF